MTTYAERVHAYEQQGMSTSDAQAVVDAEDIRAANVYAETMIRKDQRERLEGRE